MKESDPDPEGNYFAWGLVLGGFLLISTCTMIAIMEIYL